MVSKSRVDAYMWLGLTAFEQGPRQQFELFGFQIFLHPNKNLALQHQNSENYWLLLST